MSNTRRATGVPVPPSPDVAERALADVIGEAAALHLGRLLGPFLERIAESQSQPACIVCAKDAKVAERNARAAAEPEPRLKASQSFTIDPGVGPVCWAHFEPGE